MATIIRKGTSDYENQRNPIKSKSKPQYVPEAEEESLGGYALRNLAKVPTLAYEIGRTGLGLGNLTNLAARETGLFNQKQANNEYKPGTPEHYLEFKKSSPLNRPEELLRTVLPTTQQANKEARSIASNFTANPDYYTQHRPEDYWAEIALTSLPFLARGAAHGASSLGRSALQQAGLLGGSEIGSQLGEALGETIGKGELGATIGGIGGGILGHKAINALSNRPSKVIAPKVQSKKDEILNKPLNDIEEYGKRIKQLEVERAPLYKNAEQLEGKAFANPSSLRPIIDQVNERLELGVDPADYSRVNKILAPLEAAINKQSLSLSQAKKFQKNYNEQIYDRSASNGFKSVMRPVIDGLNNFIEQTGSPEHTSAWKQAEAAHREFANLKKNRKDFIAEKKLEGKKLREDYDAATNKFDQLVKDFSKSKYGGAKASIVGLGGLGYALKKIFGFAPAAAITGAVKGVQLIRNEMRIAADALKNHPEIYAEYAKLAAELPKIDKVRLVTILNDLGRQTQDVIEQENSEEPAQTRGVKIIKRGHSA